MSSDRPTPDTTGLGMIAAATGIRAIGELAAVAPPPTPKVEAYESETHSLSRSVTVALELPDDPGRRSVPTRSMTATVASSVSSSQTLPLPPPLLYVSETSGRGAFTRAQWETFKGLADRAFAEWEARYAR